MKPPVIIAIVVVVVILIGGVWYAYSNPALATKLGLRPQTAQTNSMASSTPNRRFGVSGRGGFATGSIEVLNDNGFTLTLQDGTTENVNITATTTIESYANASSTPTMETVDQLSVGEQVLAIGSPNPDGSINAVRVLTGNFPTGGAAFGHGGSGRQGSTTPGGYGGRFNGAAPEPQ